MSMPLQHPGLQPRRQCSRDNNSFPPVVSLPLIMILSHAAQYSTLSWPPMTIWQADPESQLWMMAWFNILVHWCAIDHHENRQDLPACFVLDHCRDHHVLMQSMLLGWVFSYSGFDRHLPERSSHLRDKNSRWTQRWCFVCSDISSCSLSSKNLNKSNGGGPHQTIGPYVQGWGETVGVVHGESLHPKSFPYPWHSKYLCQLHIQIWIFHQMNGDFNQTFLAWEWFTHSKVDLLYLPYGRPTVAPCGSLWSEATICNQQNILHNSVVHWWKTSQQYERKHCLEKVHICTLFRTCQICITCKEKKKGCF